MLTYAAIAVLTSISALIFLRRITTWSMIVKYRAIIDVLFTIGLFLIFAGTLGGAVVAAMGGLFLSMLLGLIRLVSRAGQRVQNGHLNL